MKYSLATLLSLISPQLFSLPMSYYVGFGFGGDITEVKQKATSTGSYAPIFIDSDYINRWEANLIDYAFHGSIFGGSNLRWGIFNLGLEDFLDCSPKRVKKP